jgi:hypothetical protein
MATVITSVTLATVTVRYEKGSVYFCVCFCLYMYFKSFIQQPDDGPKTD